MKHPETYILEFGSGAKITLTFNYFPGRPGKMYLRNGDPGYPDEPAELEILTATLTAPGLPDVPLHDYGTLLEDTGLLEKWEEEILEHWVDDLRASNDEARAQAYLDATEGL